MAKTKQYRLRLSPEMHDILKKKAKDNNTTISKLIIEAIMKYIKL